MQIRSLCLHKVLAGRNLPASSLWGDFSTRFGSLLESILDRELIGIHLGQRTIVFLWYCFIHCISVDAKILRGVVEQFRTCILLVPLAVFFLPKLCRLQ